MSRHQHQAMSSLNNWSSALIQDIFWAWLLRQHGNAFQIGGKNPQDFNEEAMIFQRIDSKNQCHDDDHEKRLGVKNAKGLELKKTPQLSFQTAAKELLPGTLCPSHQCLGAKMGMACVIEASNICS